MTTEEFERLCANLHPVTGRQLTALQLADRRVFYDFVISAPKSVSIMALLAGDPRLLKLHDESCQVAIERLESLAATRVRRNNQNEDRLTGEMVATTFRHECSRALDPQLHTHLVVFNATWDSVEERWKALQAGRIYEALSYLTEVYRTELAAGLKALGYRLRSTRHGFEIDGVSPELIRRFSKRSEAIQAAEAKLAATLGRPLTNNGRSTVARKTRPRKAAAGSEEDIRAWQRAQISPDELAALVQTVRLANNRRIEAGQITPAQALDHARDHLFERASAVTEHELLREALIHGRGDVRDHELRALLPERKEFVRVGERLTTRETMRLERELIAWVNAQTGRHRPFVTKLSPRSDLTEGQYRALGHMLQTSDGIIGLRGGAGTGKTTLLTAFVSELASRGHRVFVCAPTTEAVDVLRREGFREAQTVQRLLQDEMLQRELRNRVLLVDESSLLSVRQMHDLFRVAKAQSSRIVLSGDTRQHHSVEAGDALRVLETQSRLSFASLNEIMRQKPEAYREAVARIASGQIEQGYQQLNRLGAVVESKDQRYETLAREFVRSLQSRRSALIVSPTWREIADVTGAVRARLKAAGALGQNERTVETHESLDWTEAQRRDARNYRPGHILRFHQRTKHFAPGDWARVTAVDGVKISVRKADGREETITRKQAACFDVAQARPLAIAPGERLLLQANSRRQGLINGQLVTVSSVDARGAIHLTDGRKIPSGFRSFTHGYAVTSHGAQGKTVDHVYLAASSQSFRAASREQFYVSASRGRYRVRVFTDDRAGLLQSVRETSARLSAIELSQGRVRPELGATTNLGRKVSTASKVTV